MNTEEIRNRRNLLCETVRDAINRFEEETGTHVEQLNITREQKPGNVAKANPDARQPVTSVTAQTQLK